MNASYVGKITEIFPIELADRLESAVVVCGEGGKWQGVVEKGKWQIGDQCVAFLQDAIIPAIPGLEFMDKSKRRVKMARFRGAPSECVIFDLIVSGEVGDEVSEQLGVTKYEKPIPAQMQGQAKGNFPTFIPKTSEENFQRVQSVLEYLASVPIYATLKIDGTSATAYRRNGEFGVCSRTMDLKDGENIYWKMAKKYDLENKMPDGYAIQFEIYGETIGVPKNPLGIKGQDIAVFNLYNSETLRYCDYAELVSFCDKHELPRPPEIDIKGARTPDEWRALAEIAKYPNGKPAEGIVVRSLVETRVGRLRASMKIINLQYKD